jgi:hypothetical protein
MLSAGIDDDTLEKVTTALLTIKDNLLAEKREGAKAG